MIEYGWGDYDKTYCVLSFKERWGSLEFSKQISSLYKEIQLRQSKVNLVIDFRYSQVPPVSILSVATRALNKLPNNCGRVIIISSSNIWKRLYKTLAGNRKSPLIDIHFVTSVDDAYALLLTSDSGS